MRTILFFLVLIGLISACSQRSYPGNGELIYRSGKNKQGQKLLDKNRSQITFIKSCQACHGKSGARNPNCNIKYSYLSDAQKMTVPYNDSLFFRFLTTDLKSDGTPANTGVHFSMSIKDQEDLLDFLKSL